METTAETAKSPRIRRHLETAETVLISVIERSARCQVRVHLVRMVAPGDGDRFTYVSVGRWFRTESEETWRPDLKPWSGGPLLKTTEVAAVAAAMRLAVEIARERGWTWR